jgi:hypothetical protein
LRFGAHWRFDGGGQVWLCNGRLDDRSGRFSRRFGLDCRRDGHRLDSLDETRRRQHWCGGLGRFGGLLGGDRLLTFGNGRFGEDVAARERDVALTRQTLDELPRYDLFDGARRALDLDTVIALEQLRHFLARRAEQFCDFINPNCCQR